MAQAGMGMRYDPEADALKVQFRRGGKSARTVRAGPGVNLDFDREGRLVSLELLGASGHVPREELERVIWPPEMLTLAEAEAESGIKASTLRVLLNRGRLEGEKKGRDWLVSAVALMNYLESRDARGRPPASRKARRARNAQRAERQAEPDR